MNEPIVIDTNALSNKDFLYWLRSYRPRKILPVIAYSEFTYHMLNQRMKTIGEVRGLLRSLNIEIVNMCHNIAEIVSENCQELEEPEFKENWRDFIIGAYAQLPPYLLITDNVDDFTFVGDRVKTPDEIMQETRR